MSKPTRPYELSPHNARTSIVDGKVICEPLRKKVAITGAAQSMRELP